MKKLANRLIQGQKGQALMLTLILLGVGGLILTPLLNFMGTGLMAGQAFEDEMHGVFAADAGVEYALWHLTSGNLTVPGNGTENLTGFTINHNTVNVSVQNIRESMGETIFRINSTASGDSGSTTIKSDVSIKKPFYFAAATTGGDLDFGALLSIVTGDIYAHGNIDASVVIGVTGNATATGEIDAWLEIVGGTKTEHLRPPLRFPSAERIKALTEQLREEAALLGGTHDGDYTIKREPPRWQLWPLPPRWIPSPYFYDLGPKHITGNLYIHTYYGHKEVRLGGTVYVEGDVKMIYWGLPDHGFFFKGPGTLVAEGNITLIPPVALFADPHLDADQIPLIMSTDGNIEVPTHLIGNHVSAVLYAPRGQVGFSAVVLGDLDGAILAKEVDAASFWVNIDYPTQLRYTATSPLHDLVWRELVICTILTWEID
ncbi:hypothetical protein M1O12_01845 [Dehalococcoidia bacterium]|nr:hypothetical protein [Dehalococcoidia bacterium]